MQKIFKVSYDKKGEYPSEGVGTWLLSKECFLQQKFALRAEAPEPSLENPSQIPAPVQPSLFALTPIVGDRMRSWSTGSISYLLS